MKREAELKGAFSRVLRDSCPTLFALQLSTAGGPDRIVIGNNHVTFWEMKHATPDFESPGLQELTCMRISDHAYCRYLIWQENSRGEDWRTLIVNPYDVRRRKGWRLAPEAYCEGFDHRWAVEQVRKAHGL